ncbi:MAG: TonB-dependent receptor plug domain-containing protein, partial [Nannocystaceae bacterium]
MKLEHTQALWSRHNFGHAYRVWGLCGLVCLASLLVTLPAAAYMHPDRSPPVVGEVVDEAGQPVAGVVVEVEGGKIRATTQADGSFALTNVPPGHLHLIIQNPEFKPVRFEIPATGRNQPLVLRLRRSDESTFSVKVVASREQPATASSIELRPRDITAAPRRNAEEVLRQVPGLTLVQHGSEGKGHQILLRGFDTIHGSDFEVTLDGIPLNEWSNVHAQGYLDLGLVIPEAIGSVAVTKGPFTLDQGAFAMAGSADYRLRIPQSERGWRASYTAGSTNRHRLVAGFARPDNEDPGFLLVEATHDDGFGQNRGIDNVTCFAATGYCCD